MKLSEALGQNAIYDVLKKEAKRPVDSYMIVSEDTLMTEMCAEALISFITGLSRSEVKYNKDVYFLPQEGDKVLKDESDFINRTAYIMPTVLDKKFFVVKNAETANETAQNKLLKTLEEPPETAIIILLCANEYAMLPTIRSRCRIIRPPKFSEDVLRSIVETEYPSCANSSFAIALSDGNADRLVKAIQGGTAKFDFVLDMLANMQRSSEIAPYAVKMTAQKDDIKELLDIMELVMRDCMVFGSTPMLIRLKDNAADIERLSKSYTTQAALKEMPAIMRAKERISAGGNVNSIVDELLFSLLEEKVKCQK